MSSTNGVVYMVAIDTSPQARFAFWTAINMAKPQRDVVLLVHVAHSRDHQIVDAELLSEYGAILRDQCPNIKYKALVRRAFHIGAELCRVARDYKANFVFVGFRGASAMHVDEVFDKKLFGLPHIAASATQTVAQRLAFMGSVARFVTDNAHCNVMVIKDAVTELESEHVSKEAVEMLEELERSRRIREERIDSPSTFHEKEAEAMAGFLDEEQERARRIAEDSIIDARARRT